MFGIACIPCGSGHAVLKVGFLAFPDLLSLAWPGPLYVKARAHLDNWGNRTMEQFDD